MSEGGLGNVDIRLNYFTLIPVLGIMFIDRFIAGKA